MLNSTFPCTTTTTRKTPSSSTTRGGTRPFRHNGVPISNSRSENLEQHPSITIEQYIEFGRKLHTLQKTIDAIMILEVIGLDAAETLEAVFMRDAALLGRELALLSTDIDAAYRARCPGVYDGDKDLLRNQDGDVLRLYEHPQVRLYRHIFSFLCVHFTDLFLMSAMPVSYFLGTYKLRMQLAVVSLALGLGFCLGVNKWAFGKAPAALRPSMTTVWTTLRTIYDKAANGYRQAAEFRDRLRYGPEHHRGQFGLS
jgi:hypothetical protein